MGEGSRLVELSLRDVGPIAQLSLALAPRLNLLTGDNGLGKTFILDMIWRVLTGTWAGEPAIPHPRAALDKSLRPGNEYLTAQIGGSFTDGDPGERSYTYFFHSRFQEWLMRDGMSSGYGAKRMQEASVPGDGVVLYARVDGGFAVWDERRNFGRYPGPSGAIEERPLAFSFDRDTIWNGLKDDSGRVLCRGLIEDWISWQQLKNGAFRQLTSVLSALSPGGVESLKPGKPTRVRADDVRDIPTLQMPYGPVPITHASAGMRRICALAYMLVWSWQEHRRAAEMQRAEPAESIVLLIDEVEAHLHPEWQRSILPAVLEVVEALGAEVKVQVHATTHSPLVLASLEPIFQEEQDRIFTFDLVGKEVKVSEVPWRRRGDVSNWLTSDVFDLKIPRSKPAEAAILKALNALQNSELSNEEARTIHRELHQALGDTDPFWARWMMKARSLGIEP